MASHRGRALIRLAAAAGALVTFGSGLALAAPQPAGPAARADAPSRWLSSDSDKLSPPGCLVLVGKPPPAACLPCPPLWLGGPTIRCVLELRAPQSVSHRPPIATCPGVPLLLSPAVGSRLNGRLCGTGFMDGG